MTAITITDHLSYLQDYRVVVCTQCKYCIQPSGGYTHFLSLHKDLSKATRKVLVEHCKGLDLDNPAHVVPSGNKTVVHGLSLNDGFKCKQPAYSYTCSQESSAEAHGREHGWVTGRPRTWMKIKVQVRALLLSDIDILSWRA
jgi:Orsellinic acid/F9775 biosynthesis cluster protein D